MWLRRTGGCTCAYRVGSIYIAENLCLSVTKQPLVSKIGLRERLRVCRGGSRNQLRGLKEGGKAMRGAMLCLPADLTTHTDNNFSPCRVLKWAGTRGWRRSAAKDGKDDGMKVLSAAKYGSVKVFIVVQERRASRSPSWRRSAAKDGKVTLTDPLDQLCGIRR